MLETFSKRNAFIRISVHCFFAVCYSLTLKIIILIFIQLISLRKCILLGIIELHCYIFVQINICLNVLKILNNTKGILIFGNQI